MFASLKKIIKHIIVLIIAVAVVELTIISHSLVAAATMTVNSNTNNYAPDGLCSLPEAIFNANGNVRLFAISGECPAGTVSIDTINLANNVVVSGVIDTQNGDNGLPSVTSSIIINGNNNTIYRPTEIDSFIKLRFFNITNTGSLELNNLKIANGEAVSTATNGTYGGAIYNAGNLTLTNATIRDSEAFHGAAVYNTGTMTLAASIVRDNSSTQSGSIFNHSSGNLAVDSTIFLANTATSGHGGAINSMGTVTVKNSTLTSNVAGNGSGGAILVDGPATIVNSTFRGNSATNGGALVIEANGDFTVVNSIFGGNHASNWGGAIYNRKTGTIHNSTIAGNYAGSGGGIYHHDSATVLTVYNSLLWGNESLNGSQIYNDSNLTVLFSGLEGGFADVGGVSGLFNSAGMLTLYATDELFGNPVRATGANTPNTSGNYFLYKYSLVINQGWNDYLPPDTLDIDNDGNTAEDLPLDRDGNARIMETTVDMGADESTRCNGINFPFTASTADALRLAIVCANVTPAWDVINLSGNITLTDKFDNLYEAGLPGITSQIRINGNGYAIRRISGETFRILFVDSTGELTLNNIRISGGSANGSGGGIFATGKLKLIRTIISGNQATAVGGGIAQGNAAGSLEIFNSLLIGNRSFAGGSAINTYAPTTIVNVTFGGNAGAETIWGNDNLALQNSVIYGNSITSPAQIANSSGVTTIAYSAVQNLSDVTYVNNGGNINLGGTPTLFIAPQPAANAPTTAGNYRLAQFSPVINKGSNAIANSFNLNVDFEGDPRIRLGTIDMGADETYYLPPENTNLLYNPGFSLGAGGEGGWSSTGSLISTVNSGVMNLRFPATVDGWLRQYRAAYSLPIQAKMVAWVTVSNPDAFARGFQLIFRDSDLSNTYLCNFVIPANAQNQVFSIKFITQTNWEIIEADMRPNYVNVNGLNFDNVNLRYRPTETFTANQTCISPGADENHSPPPDTELVLIR